MNIKNVHDFFKTLGFTLFSGRTNPEDNVVSKLREHVTF